MEKEIKKAAIKINLRGTVISYQPSRRQTSNQARTLEMGLSAQGHLVQYLRFQISDLRSFFITFERI